jgi:hypothetical protein
MITTFADDTTLLSNHENPILASEQLSAISAFFKLGVTDGI